MNTLTKTISKYVFAVPFLIFGIMHLMFIEGMKGLVPSYMPFPEFWVALTGLAFIGASISIIIGIWDYWASFLLGLMVLIFALFIHLVNVMGGDQASMANLLKDLIITGAAWTYTGFVAKSRTFKKA